MCKRYILIELMEPMEGSDHAANSREATQEFFSYLENEFDNQGHRVNMTIIEETGND